MDPQVSTSFIPKKPLTGERGGGGVYSLIMLVAVLVFVASGAAAGGAFLYGRILAGSLESKKASLEKSQEAYEPGAIEDLVRLDARINQARTLLAKHVAPTTIFGFLSMNTLENVRFTNFEYALSEQGVATIELKGSARDFSTVALQSDQFGASKMLRDVVFSNISIGEGGVTFDVRASINSSDLLFSKQMNEGVFVPPESASTTPVEDSASASTTSPDL